MPCITLFMGFQKNLPFNSLTKLSVRNRWQTKKGFVFYWKKKKKATIIFGLLQVRRADKILQTLKLTQNLEVNRSLKYLKSYTGCVAFFFFFFVSVENKLIFLSPLPASEWLFLIQYGLPIIAELEIPPIELSFLSEIYFLCLTWHSSTFKKEMLAVYDRQYRVLLNRLKTYLHWSECDLNYHLPCHLRELILRWGPLIGFWCWAMERQNQVLKVFFRFFLFFIFLKKKKVPFSNQQKIIDSGNKKDVENYIMREV